LDAPELGIAITKHKCKNTFYECPFVHHCWKDVPEYSVFDAFRGARADEIFAEFGADLSNLPPEIIVGQMHAGDIESFINNQEIVKPNEIREFLTRLHYPLYFLDYESINPPIPMFDGTRPYQQICFQFSLHILRAPNAELEHYEFLHDAGSDPRPALCQKLIELCGTDGDVIVYNAPFEMTRNREMAKAFPQFANGLNAINSRIVDLLIPFRNRALYKPSQHGSASIKKTLPAFTDISYDNMEIGNGTAASGWFMAFMKGILTPEQTEQMRTNLLKYCGQDTFAMVALLRVLEKYTS
jgi:hypothetical protein